LLTEKKCQDSTTSNTILGAFSYEQIPPLTEDASRLLREHGPDVFKSIFGSYFVWKLLIGAESGFCVSMGSESHTERESMSVVVDIDLLFWSVSVEQELVSKVESHLKQSFEIAYFDTIGGVCIQKTGTEMDVVELNMLAKTVKNDVGKLQARLQERVEAVLDSPDVSLVSKELLPCVTSVLVAPWSVLEEWHNGVREWKTGCN
jgi:hypothetical protein